MSQITQKNYAVIVYENGYPYNPKGIATLIGIYPTERAALFMRRFIREKHRLPYVNIEPTTNPITTDKVENFLERMDEIKKEETE